MDTEAAAVVKWAERYQGVIRLLTAAMDVFVACIPANEFSGIQPLGDRLPGLMKFVNAANVESPTDSAQLASWDRLLSLFADLGGTARLMPMAGEDFAAVVVEITEEFVKMDELLNAARLVIGGS